MKCVVAVHKLTGEHVNLPVGQSTEGYKVLNGIQFELPDGTKPFVEAEEVVEEEVVAEEVVEEAVEEVVEVLEEEVEGFEFNGKVYKTEAAKKAAITKAAKAVEVEAEVNGE